MDGWDLSPEKYLDKLEILQVSLVDNRSTDAQSNLADNIDSELWKVILMEFLEKPSTKARDEVMFIIQQPKWMKDLSNYFLDQSSHMTRLKPKAEAESSSFCSKDGIPCYTELEETK